MLRALWHVLRLTRPPLRRACAHSSHTHQPPPSSSSSAPSSRPPSPSQSQSQSQPHLSPILSAVLAARASHPAIVDASGTLTYTDLSARASHLARVLRPITDHRPVGLFLPPDSSLVSAMLAVWHTPAPVVPLSPLFPAAALAPLIDKVEPCAIVTHSAMRHALPPTKAPVVALDDLLDRETQPDTTATLDAVQEQTEANDGKDALIFFTSGTTGEPKGVVWTHDMVRFHVDVLSRAWHWSQPDRILNVLPLHHIHGMVNVVLTALYNGATIDMHGAFDPHSVWSAIAAADPKNRPTVFMAVPAVYRRLIEYHSTLDSLPVQRRLAQCAREMRLFVSGSAALPHADFERWEAICGHRILERYGMTETGMTLSQRYDDRRSGMLGAPLPGVETRISNPNGDNGDHNSAHPGEGELLARGPGVFDGYWNDPAATVKSFTSDGFFRTGDIVKHDPESGYLELLGRGNSDFINTGGFKVSSVEIENVIRDVDGVIDCCVVGMPDEVVGERIVAAVHVVAGKDREAVLKAAQRTAETKLPRYKVPWRMVAVDDLPRNVMGKVQKMLVRLRLLETT